MTTAGAKRYQMALGYWELRMLDECTEELDALPPEDHNVPEALSLRASLFIDSKRWQEAEPVTARYISIAPDQDDARFKRAYVLHELRRTAEARDCLIAGPATLRANPLFYYNLACYEVQLGNVEGGRTLLQKATALDPQYRRLAANDPDLAPLFA